VSGSSPIVRANNGATSHQQQRELPQALAPTSRRELEAAGRLRRARTRGRPVVVQLPDGVLSGAVGPVARTAGIACVGEDVGRLQMS
jgi:hypothetical protein